MTGHRTEIALPGPERLSVATYNIHKGVQGMGPARRLEIANLARAIRRLDADIICLQEVRGFNRREAVRFGRHWPDQSQASYLAPRGYHSVYRTNATTRHGEHGNALLSRWPIIGCWHEDMSDHRFEQRGLLHVEVDVPMRPLHVIVVHFGLIPASRMRQAQQLKDYIARRVPPQAPLLVAGDFNDWGQRVQQVLCMDALEAAADSAALTFPARFPVVQLDHIYTRGLPVLELATPASAGWHRLSDHLPLLAECSLPLASPLQAAELSDYTWQR